MKPSEEQIRAEATRYDPMLLNSVEIFIDGALWALSQDSVIEKVKELRDEIEETYFRLEKDKFVLDKYALGIMVTSKACIDSLNAIIENEKDSRRNS